MSEKEYVYCPLLGDNVTLHLDKNGKAKKVDCLFYWHKFCNLKDEGYFLYKEPLLYTMYCDLVDLT